jgi:GNAT superfamily N-acetyltransferase
MPAVSGRTRERVEIEAPAELRAAVRARGVSDATLDRALAAGVPLQSLQGWLSWRRMDEADLAALIGWHERFTTGDLRAREVTVGDAAAFSDLWENSPEEIGDLEITVLRSPDPFAQFRLQGNVQLNVIADGNVLVASCGWARRNVWIGGRRVSVRYGQALRVHQGYRRQGLGDAVRLFPAAMTAARPSLAQYDIMRSGNFAVVGWWNKHVPGFFEGTPQREGEVPGIPVSVTQVPAAASVAESAAVRPARPADLSACVELVNRTHGELDLFRPYSSESLEECLDEGYWGARVPWYTSVYGWPDFFVLESAGRVRACAGLWDRGRDLRERIRKKTGETRTFAGTALLDWGYAEGAVDAMVELVGHLTARTRALGRDFLLLSVDQIPELAKRLEPFEPASETRYLRWNAQPEITRPHTDLRYW